MTKNRRPDIVLPERELEQELRRRTRRGFLVGGLAAAGAVGAYEWVLSRKQENEVAWPQRRVLSANQKLSQAYLSDSHLTPEYPLKEVAGLKPNGDIGMEDQTPDQNWQVGVQNTSGGLDRNVSLADIRELPKVEMTTKFCCIEGWSTITNWGGAKFSDFTKKYFPSGQPLPRYVYMATPSEEYYVGLDMKSALHPQTILAYEQNGKPLTSEHGAPLRLVIPVKYGIKNIKRIGSIQYVDKQPDNYWYEAGYDWFAGL